MEAGDKVRFLNDVGGGILTAIRKDGIALVEDEDGFVLPVPQNELVVVADNPRTSRPHPITNKRTATEKAEASSNEHRSSPAESTAPSSPTHTNATPTVVPSTEPDELRQRVETLENELKEYKMLLHSLREALEANGKTISTLLEAHARTEKAEQEINTHLNRLDAENILRKNELAQLRAFGKSKEKEKEKERSTQPRTLEDLHIL